MEVETHRQRNRPLETETKDKKDTGIDTNKEVRTEKGTDRGKGRNTDRKRISIGSDNCLLLFNTVLGAANQRALTPLPCFRNLIDVNSKRRSE